MSFTNIINSFLNVRNKVKNSEGNWVDQRELKVTKRIAYARPNLENGEHVALEIWDKKVIIDTIEYSTDTNQQVFPKLYIEENHGTGRSNSLFLGIGLGGTIWDLTAAYIKNTGNAFFEVVEGSAGYKVILKKPIELPNGCKLVFAPGSSFDGNSLTYQVSYRTFE